MAINETYYGASYFKDAFMPELANRMNHLLYAPTKFPEMIWIAIPLLTTLLLMEFYFGRYRDEELGWNTALGNSLVLVFVGIDLLRRIYGETFFASISMKTTVYLTPQTLIALTVLCIGIIMIMVDFFHMLPKSFAYLFSSPLFVNLTSYFAIIFIYTNAPIDLVSFLAAAMLFAIFILAIDIMHLVIPKYKTKTNVEKIMETVFKPQ
ncbi:hypothetical protein HYU11_06210 [Candidatus Woesearchaeota archaeon]|nr:hypothetical protein [Candidatus Woesearchaeota archaeon]